MGTDQATVLSMVVRDRYAPAKQAGGVIQLAQKFRFGVKKRPMTLAAGNPTWWRTLLPFLWTLVAWRPSSKAVDLPSVVCHLFGCSFAFAASF